MAGRGAGLCFMTGCRGLICGRVGAVPELNRHAACGTRHVGSTLAGWRQPAGNCGGRTRRENMSGFIRLAELFAAKDLFFFRVGGMLAEKNLFFCRVGAAPAHARTVICCGGANLLRKKSVVL
jgi:hypothetical protein